jgi:hypothetical protein
MRTRGRSHRGSIDHRQWAPTCARAGIRPIARGVGAGGRSTGRDGPDGRRPRRVRPGVSRRTRWRRGRPGRAIDLRSSSAWRRASRAPRAGRSRALRSRGGRAGSARTAARPAQMSGDRRSPGGTSPRPQHTDRNEPPSLRARAGRPPGVRCCTPRGLGGTIVIAIGSASSGCGRRFVRRRDRFHAGRYHGRQPTCKGRLEELTRRIARGFRFPGDRSRMSLTSSRRPSRDPPAYGTDRASDRSASLRRGPGLP